MLFVGKDYRFLIAFFLLPLAAVFVFSCKGKNTAAAAAPPVDSATIYLEYNKSEVKKAELLLTEGCLVTRSDNDFESLSLMNFLKRDKSYSHVGLAFKEDSSFYVYNIMTGAENPSGCCRRDRFDSFVNPSEKTGFGIFKYSLTPKETESLKTFMQAKHNSKLPFDIFFNLQKSDSMYCSELVYKALKSATNNRVVVPTSFMKNFTPKLMGFRFNKVFFKSFEYVGIDDLYLNPFCKETIRVKYKYAQADKLVY
jgi:hypothetical protein